MWSEQIGLMLARENNEQSIVERVLDVFPNNPKIFNYDPRYYDPFYDPYGPENWDH
jgi:hypothetical protein